MRTHVLIISAVVVAGIAAAGLVYWLERAAPGLAQAEAAGKAPEPAAATPAAAQPTEAPAPATPQAAAPEPAPGAGSEPAAAAAGESRLVIGLRPINRLPPPPPAEPRPPPPASPPPGPRATVAHRTHQKPAPPPPMAPAQPNGASSGIRF